jgi:uncharacterized protein YcaQ
MSTTRSLPAVHRLTKAQARRIAVRAQLLDAPGPTDLVQAELEDLASWLGLGAVESA